MLKIGCRHKVDIEAFNLWHKANGLFEYNSAEEFFEWNEKVYLDEIDDTESDEYFGEKLYYFSNSKEDCEDFQISFWDDSLRFFTPIEDVSYIQEEMEI